jgi:predicted  nucleic acid-binding Zn-ribbon protein
MSDSRSDWRNEQAAARAPNNTAALAETLRNGADNGSARPARAEERVSLFWRICGGTVLSILALAAVTVYQQINASLNELRNDFGRLTESQADIVKKDEFNTRLTTVWNSMKDLQGTVSAVTALKERTALLEQQLKSGQEHGEADAKELEALNSAVTVLKERAMLQEQQTKQEEERKELVRELQQLRERLANLEGRQASTAPARMEHSGEQ